MADQVETAISQLFADRILVRGYNLIDLAATRSFGDVVYLLLKGQLPSRAEGRLIEAMLVVMAEHSINAPSTQAARTVAGCGSPMQSAIAAGVSAIGDFHGGAGEACARLLQETLVATDAQANVDELAHHLVQDFRRRNQRLPGFGHRFHDPDPRAVFLLQLAEALGLAGRHVKLAQALVDALHAQGGRSLPLNVDGALAALISDLGFHWRLGKGVFILARTAGLLAHVQEEMSTGKPFGATPKADVRYVGPGERAVVSEQ
ncbi:MAG: citryl-CoA lyase [Chloroflexota bacterium]|nr:citryl-CoA lyase [Chloroflexota bacterium]